MRVWVRVCACACAYACACALLFVKLAEHVSEVTNDNSGCIRHESKHGSVMKLMFIVGGVCSVLNS